MDNPEYNSEQNQKPLMGEDDLPSQEEIYNSQIQNKETQDYYPPPIIQPPPPPPITYNIPPQSNIPQEEIPKPPMPSNNYQQPNFPIEGNQKFEEQPPFPIPIAYNVNEPVPIQEPNPVPNNINQPTPIIINPVPVPVPVVVTDNPEIVVKDPIVVPAVNYPQVDPQYNNVRRKENIQPVRNYPQNARRNDDECDDECCQALLCLCLCLRCLAILAGGR